MKAPKYQRAEMLETALREAVQILDDPVEGLEMTDRCVVAWASGRFILMTYRWDNDYAADGTPLPGAGAWSAQYVADCDASSRHSPERLESSRPWWHYWWRTRAAGRR
jgi:hypothetical protein